MKFNATQLDYVVRFFFMMLQLEIVKFCQYLRNFGEAVRIVMTFEGKQTPLQTNVAVSQETKESKR